LGADVSEGTQATIIGILGDKLSTEIKNKIAVSDKEKMEK